MYMDTFHNIGIIEHSLDLSPKTFYLAHEGTVPFLCLRLEWKITEKIILFSLIILPSPYLL